MKKRDVRLHGLCGAIQNKLIAATVALGLLLGMLPAATAQAATPGVVGSWTSGANLPASMGGEAAATYNGYLYVIGGSDGGTYSWAVYSAKVNNDGSITPWATETNHLPTVVTSASAVAYNGYLYVMGGYSGSIHTSVYYAKLNNDGSVGSWNTSANPLTQGLQEANAYAYNGKLYISAGRDGSGNSYKQTYYATLNSSDGSVDTWTTSPQLLPNNITAAASAVHNGYVYIMGGYKLGVLSDIYYTKINTDGTINAWSTASNSLPQSMYQMGAVVVNDNLYAIGGYGSSSALDTVYYAPLNSDGSVGSWKTNAVTLPTATYMHQTVTYNNYIYVLGGNTGSYTNATRYAYVTPPASVSTANSVTAPDTGAGEPSASSHLAGYLVAAALLLLFSGLALLKKSKS